MNFTANELSKLKTPEKTQPDRSYIKRFAESHLKKAKEFLDQGYSHKQLDEIFGLPKGGTLVSWGLQRWHQGGVPNPKVAEDAYDIDVTRAGPPSGGTRRKRTWQP